MPGAGARPGRRDGTIIDLRGGQRAFFVAIGIGLVLVGVLAPILLWTAPGRRSPEYD